MLSLCFLFYDSILALSVTLRSPRPGCGTQRLLRCRLHPAGRCPNSSSLFPPLAAVVAVAPKGGALGGAPCPLYKYTENPVGKGRSAGKTQKNRFPSCQTGQNALFYSHSLTV